MRRRHVGRPRADGSRNEGHPRDEIIAVASRLFSEHGVARTTMSEIARRSGLRQSSVYYHFKDRDQILVEIVSVANRVILEHLERVTADGGSAAERLYRLLRFDARQMCRFAFDINEIYRLGALQDERFADFWNERQELNDAVAALIAEGIADGALREVDPTLTALVLLSNDEGTQNWFRSMGEFGQVGGDHYDPEDIATFVADLALAGLLRDRDQVDHLRARALELDPRD
ncbi:MAG: TetR/AcrR family transcriptional regulator [Thermoleophilia bacterium]|nr:TetR/AcrR family transcriptional regulator [Thermoleophilia bacterium]